MPEREGMPSRVEEVLSLLASQSKIPCALPLDLPLGMISEKSS